MLVNSEVVAHFRGNRLAVAGVAKTDIQRLNRYSSPPFAPGDILDFCYPCPPKIRMFKLKPPKNTQLKVSGLQNCINKLKLI